MGKGKGTPGRVGGFKAVTDDDNFFVCRICRIIHKSIKVGAGPKQHTVPPYERADGAEKHGRGTLGWVVQRCNCKWMLNPTAANPGKCTCAELGGVKLSTK